MNMDRKNRGNKKELSRTGKGKKEEYEKRNKQTGIELGTQLGGDKTFVYLELRLSQLGEVRNHNVVLQIFISLTLPYERRQLLSSACLPVF